jgi:hypothetical protein
MTAMRVNRGFLGWGVFFILVGAIPLAVNAGYLAADQVDQWWSFWPLILIGIGLGIVLARTSLDWLGGVVVAATFGLIVGSVAATGIGGVPLSGACTTDARRGTAFAAQSGTLAGPSTVSLDLDCGEFDVTAAPGTGWALEGTDEGGQGPIVEAGANSLHVESRPREFPFGGEGDVWRLSLPQQAGMAVDVELNAGSGHLALAGAELADVGVEMNAGAIDLNLAGATTIGDLDVGINAGSIGITLPNLSLEGTIEANAGSVEICTPPGTALRIETGESITASYDFDDNGLIESERTWTSPDFETAQVRIELRTTGNAASFSLNPEDGCGG